MNRRREHLRQHVGRDARVDKDAQHSRIARQIQRIGAERRGRGAHVEPYQLLAQVGLFPGLSLVARNRGCRLYQTRSPGVGFQVPLR